MIDWSNTEIHPSDGLPDMNCELLELYATHPDPDISSELIKELGFDFRIDPAEQIGINAIIKSPGGIFEI